MTTYNTILYRRSIRKYLDKKVEDKDLKKILKAAMASPSARGQTCWEFYIIKDKDKQKEIKSLSIHYNFNSPLQIVVAANLDNLVKDDTFWIQDISAATQSILLMATELNLGTCWCGIYPKIEAVEKFRQILNLKNNIVPVSLIHLGHSAEAKEPRTRYDNSKITII